MFFLRSAFWLTVMFVIIAPKDADLGRDLDQASREALAMGQKAVVEHVLKDCPSLECAGGKAALTVLAAPKLPSAEASPEASIPVPLPRPRPERMG
jgi:hypothetical protein